MKLRVVFNDMKYLNIEVPDDKVENVLTACGRGVGWSSAELGLYIDGKDVRVVHEIDSNSLTQPEIGDSEGWVDMG